MHCYSLKIMIILYTFVMVVNLLQKTMFIIQFCVIIVNSLISCSKLWPVCAVFVMKINIKFSSVCLTTSRGFWRVISVFVVMYVTSIVALGVFKGNLLKILLKFVAMDIDWQIVLFTRMSTVSFAVCVHIASVGAKF